MIADAAQTTDAVFLAREEIERFYIDPLPEAGLHDKKTRDDFPAFEWKTEIKATPFDGVFETKVMVFHRGASAKEGSTPIFELTTYVMK